MKMLRKIIPVLTLFVLLSGPILIQAADSSDTGAVIGGKTGVETVIKNITTWFSTILYLLVVLFIIIGAFYYLTAGGDTEKTKKAKGYILGAVIALILAILASSFKEVIKDLLTGK